ncbi:MAG: beta-N-acetylhexosaminidase [Flavobacteriia bacterium]|jgi:hexosaminidase
MLKFRFLFVFGLFSWFAIAQECPILPTPAVYQTTNGQFVSSGNLVIDPSQITPNLLESFKSYALWSKGIEVSPFVQNPMVQFKKMTNVKQDSYSINIAERITISYSSEASCFYAWVSLLQLSQQKEGQLIFPKCFVKDYPKFQWRGLHLDVSRHFFSVDEVKRFLDLMAYYKFNTFHWHLTDDQGWRIEIKKYPLLTEVGAWRDSTVENHYSTLPRTYDKTRYGGFYTQEQIKEVVAYAAARFIEVVPEIEMPGHARAALAAYPQYACTGEAHGVEGLWGIFDDIFCAKEESILFLQEILSEILPLFPSTYVHVGGDEAPKTRWESCPKCQAVIKANDLHDEHELQSYFIGRMDAFLTQNGKKLIGWDEILEGGLSPNATVMSWRGYEGGKAAAAQGHYVVMCPGSHCYFDHYQGRGAEEPLAIGGFTSLEKVLSFNPIPPDMNTAEAAYVLGAQGNLWTEYIPNMSQLEYMTYPRAIALSTALWSETPTTYEKFFSVLTNNHFPFLETQKVNFSKSCLKPNLQTSRSENGGIVIQKTAAKGIIANSVAIAGIKAAKRKTKTVQIKVDQGPNLPSKEMNIIAHKALGAKVHFITKPSPKYDNGDLTIVDGQLGARPWKGNEWLGFDSDSVAFDIVFDKPIKVKELRIHTLHDPNSWIWAAQTYNISFSKTGVGNGIADGYSSEETIVIENIKDKTKTIHVVLYGAGYIPSGHPGAGNVPWLFIDEIEVR